VSGPSRRLAELIAPAATQRAGPAQLPLLSMTMHHGLVDQSAKFKKRIASLDTSEYKVVKRGQLVVGFPIDEGVLDFQTAYDEALVSPAYGLWDVRDEDVLDREYLARYLRSTAALSYYKAKLRGTTARRRSLPAEIFLDLPVPVPSIVDQRRIADVLDRADALRVQARRIAELLGHLAGSMFVSDFGDPRGRDARWPSSTIGELTRVVRGASPRPAGDPRYFGGPIPWLKISDITATAGMVVEQVREGVTPAGRDRSVLVPAGTLILTNSATVGIPKFLGVDACIHDGFLALLDIESRVNPTYLYFSLLLRRTQLLAMAPKGTQANLNTGLAKAIPVPLPPRELQDEFVARLATSSRVHKLINRHLSHMDELVASLLHRAFRGEL
jgi:type I restriction enzyme, S subunit